eukprot:s264_g18.t1
MSEKRLQTIARAEAAKKRKEYFEAHYERFRYKPGQDEKKGDDEKKAPDSEVEKKPEVKKMPRKSEVKESSPSRASIDLRSRSPSKKPKDEGRAGSALAKSSKKRTFKVPRGCWHRQHVKLLLMWSARQRRRRESQLPQSPGSTLPEEE